MNKPTLPSIVLKTVLMHSMTYFLMGLLASTLFDYAGRFADPNIAILMRQTSDPRVAAGPLLQVFRGALFGVAFYYLREIVFLRKNGWLILWLELVVIGILSPFGAAPSSIEGLIYTHLPLSFHLTGLPEVLLQSLLLAWGLHYWINHPEKKWLNWVLGIGFVLMALMSFMGILAGLGILTVPAG